MRKVVVVIFSIMICCNVVFGSGDLNGKNLSDPIDQEITNSVVESSLSLKEKVLYYFEKESDIAFYKRTILDDYNISQGTAAKLLCHYIEKSPIYLPQKEVCSSPYIGRLVVEAIWENRSYDEKQFITLEDWDFLFNRAQQFKEDKDYLNKTLSSDKINIKEKINQYRDTINKDRSLKKTALGTMTKSNLELSENDKTYAVYQFLDTSYISLKTLENIGFVKQTHSNQTQLLWQEDAIENTTGDQVQADLIKKDIFINNEPVYIGELETYSLSVGEEVFIPIRALQVYFDIDIFNNQILLNLKTDFMSQYVLCDSQAIINQTSEPLKIIYTDLYWDGSSIIENVSELSLIDANGKLSKNSELHLLRNAQYLTTIIQYIETDYQTIEMNNKLGQDDLALLKKYNQEITKPALNPTPNPGQLTDKGFPPSIIIGTMKYSVKGFTKGQKVEVWAAEDHISYFVKDSKNKTVQIPWSSISIPKNPETAKDKPTKAKIEDFINSQNISSKTIYLVWTDLYRQQTYIFKGQKNEWQLIRTILSSSGKNTTPTPRGKFTLTNRVPYFGVAKGYRAKNAFQIFGDYLYHSIIFDVTGTRLLEGKGVLGHRASHGCIRFSEEESLWFYNTMKSGTTVWIN